MKRKICIAGATGFTGREVLRRLLCCEERYDIRVFARSARRVAEAGFSDKSLTVHYGSFDDPPSLMAALKHCDVFICCASLGFGHAPALIECCHHAGVQRVIFTSTTGIFTRLNPASKALRIAAEEAIRTSTLDYTLIRPTMIHGSAQDRNICRLIRYIARWPLLPVPGPGTFLIQPVYVHDLAEAYISILENPATIGKEYNLSGAEAVSFNELCFRIARLLHTKIFLLHCPRGLLAFPLGIYEALSRRPRLKVEQLVRLTEDKAFSFHEGQRDFGYAPTALNTALHREIRDIFGDPE